MLLTVCLPLLAEELPDLNYVIPRSTKLEMTEIPTESLPDLKSIFLTIDEEEEKPQLLEEIPLVEDES